MESTLVKALPDLRFFHNFYYNRNFRVLSLLAVTCLSEFFQVLQSQRRCWGVLSLGLGASRTPPKGVCIQPCYSKLRVVLKGTDSYCYLVV